ILQTPAQYAIDYDNKRIAFYPRVGDSGKSRKFVLTFSYYADRGNGVEVLTLAASSSTIITVPDQPSNTVPAGQQPRPLWQDIFDQTTGIKQPANFLSLKRNSEDVSRQFLLAKMTGGSTVLPGPSAPQWTSDDPYEYAWYSPQEGSANVGVLLFNPRGHN